MKKKYADGGRARSAPSYEEDMTPPPGMRNFRPRTLPGGEEPAARRRVPVEIPSYEEDITPPRGMMRPSREPMPLPPIPPPMPPRRMAKGGAVKMAGGGCTRGDGIASRGKTKGRMI